MDLKNFYSNSCHIYKNLANESIKYEIFHTNKFQLNPICFLRRKKCILMFWCRWQLYKIVETVLHLFTPVLYLIVFVKILHILLLIGGNSNYIFSQL